MAQLTDYSWLSAVTYRRGRANQLNSEEKGWAQSKWISDNSGDPTFPEGGAGGFSTVRQSKPTRLLAGRQCNQI